MMDAHRIGVSSVPQALCQTCCDHARTRDAQACPARRGGSRRHARQRQRPPQVLTHERAHLIGEIVFGPRSAPNGGEQICVYARITTTEP
jgi:hypothetical protein